MTITDLKLLLDKRGQVFLTGAGGTGKTYTLQHLLPRYENPVVLATTNSASVRINGDTVHSAFRLGTANSLPELRAEDNRYVAWFIANVNSDPDIAKKSRLKPIRELFKGVDLIVIDEVSMLSASTFDLLFVRFNQAEMAMPPLLMLGDLFQIPPVEVKEAVVPQKMIYHSENFNPQIIELTEIKRTENKEFAHIQKALRKGKYTQKAHEMLEAIQDNVFDNNFKPTCLVSNNAQADKINHQMLEALKTKSHTFEAHIETAITDKRRISQVISYMPPDKSLTLKINARVMFIANDKEKLYYNGLQGTITDFLVNDDKTIIGCKVLADNGANINVKPLAFEKRKLKNDAMGNVIYETELKMEQLPLRVCYAMTIHKSQGASIKQLEIDCSRIFVAGQFYVAISRAIDPAQIRLKNFNPRYVRIRNPDLDNFMEQIKDKIIYVDNIEDDAPKVEVKESNYDKVAHIPIPKIDIEDEIPF